MMLKDMEKLGDMAEGDDEGDTLDADFGSSVGHQQSSILHEMPETHNKRVDRLKLEAKNVKKVYLRRKSPKEATLEVVESTLEVVITEAVSKEGV
ncbi:hypothetical protein L1987_38517 [Smallanthus sonchifolius]|uniref:Uncharacterized protein n=1 Tax=Smallanthus sonchifolius TaxID=185202 RepID=A0ACB9HJR1_9ASTR|nr:hypothetical protein L1987_38517 [Smallanthus sonchifolius]